MSCSVFSNIYRKIVNRLRFNLYQKSILMTSNYIISLLCISLISITSCEKEKTVRQTDESDKFIITKKFEFYSNLWINQHHFLYANADSAEGGNWDDGFNEGELEGLSSDEKDILKEGITFYRDSVISYNLLFNRGLFNLKRKLIDFGQNDDFAIENFSDDLVLHLNRVKPVYEKYFWEKHDLSNREIVTRNLEFINRYENQIFDRIATLAQQSWKDEKVRVDVSYYANWAGAYTSTQPETHVVITSQGRGIEGDWLELLFHEPSHSIISGSEYKVAEAISEAAENLELNPPRNLWHSLLFYFSGIAVQEALEDEEIEYELYMIRNDVFGNHHEVIFEHMPGYVNGETTLEEALKKLITAYNE